ncbi:DUF1330 domain-containing protein [Nitratireductor kimnyeongensis]|uniref:DUF1330 domain-containing protein n=1 Tax=Nitratireductor kimnyeongensis TaxID=430679 RepID=A0ABW0TCK0_9HYPH|nr:DUF1330 domain-containing protein [Nitratireductor kimnyeongensis]QZZ36523.1 DUF1330 domain-containing protein [Nitratireductor kimnyeongensis]
MPAYAIGHLRNVVVGPAIIEYLERIDETLEPFGGQFIIHGAQPDVREGNWEGDLIVIAFPSRQKAEDWYISQAYEAIKRLRSDHSDGDILLIDGVDPGHKASDVLITFQEA